MNDPVRRIADAVLYEGYLLWPYRRSATKNQQRWTFGCVMPPAWSAGHPDETSTAAVQCLVESHETPVVDVGVRFLHVVHRQLIDAEGRAVDALTENGATHLTWDEAVEREVRGGGAFVIPAGHAAEPLERGTIVRSWREVRGSVEVVLAKLTDGVRRLSVRVRNCGAGAPTSRNDAATRAFCSMHVVIHVHHGQFVSPLDSATSICRQDHLWPVLVGTPPARDTILASAIVLEEYPAVAPESPGDLFDGGEIDQLLTLNILAMSDAEKAEMRATDPRARAILERTEQMTAEDLMHLHGALRDVRQIGGAA